MSRPSLLRRRAVPVAACAAVVLVPGLAAAAPGPPPAAAPLVLADQAAWCWFADPRAVALGGRAVFGWVGDDGSIVVGDDLGRRATLDPGLERDDHDNPAFYVRRDGRLMAFWSAHNGPQIRYRTATSGIDGWGPVRTGPANPPGTPGAFTYPNPMRVGDTLWLFWSGAGTTATYATSPDDGETWTASRTLFDPAGPRVRYVKYRQAGQEIHLAWTLGHPRERTSAVYHAVIRDGRVERQDGHVIGRLGAPVDPTAGDVVHARDRAGAWVHDLLVRRGQPTIVYATFPSPTDHRYRYATWSGRWTDEQLTPAGGSFEGSGLEPNYSGGVVLDPGDPRSAFVSRPVGAHHELDRATRTPDGWSLTPLTRGSTGDQVRPYPVAGGLAWMRGDYPGYTTFRTTMVWRPAKDPRPIGAVPAAARVRLPSRALRAGGALRLRTTVRRADLQVRIARPAPGVGLPRVVARIAVPPPRDGAASVTVPGLRAGRYRVSVWQGDRRITGRLVRIRARGE